MVISDRHAALAVFIDRAIGDVRRQKSRRMLDLSPLPRDRREKESSRPPDTALSADVKRPRPQESPHRRGHAAQLQLPRKDVFAPRGLIALERRLQNRQRSPLGRRETAPEKPRLAAKIPVRGN